MGPIEWMTAEDLAKYYSKQELSPVDVVEYLIERIDRYDDNYNVFIFLDREGAMRQAKQAEQDIRTGKYLGPLHGVPVGIKDIIDVAGLPTTAHSELLKDNIATEDADVVKRLRKQGAIILGKVATHEFALGGPSFDLPFPPARNPWNRDHHPGGSSSGSGAGLAAGFFPLAIGTDTGGSVRHPSAACGVVGLKATFDKVSCDGVIPLSKSLDHVGPMARSINDLRCLQQAITSDSCTLEPVAGNLKGVRIGFVRQFHEHDIPADQDVKKLLENAADVLTGLGAEIVDVKLPSLAEFAKANRVILVSEAWSVHKNWIRQQPEKYSKLSRTRLLPGAFISAEAYFWAKDRAAVLTQAVDDVLDGVDVLLMANAMTPACRVDDEASVVANYHRHARTPFNLTGHPALAIMCGFADSGLPVGLQFVGRKDQEDILFNAASAYESATDWSEQHAVLIEKTALA